MTTAKALLAALAAALAATPAAADWQRARTAHFVLTINDTPEQARDFATRIERYDAALRRLYNVADDPGQDPRPIAIWAMQPELYGPTCECPGVLGFYRPQTVGSFIFTLYNPAVDRKAKVGSWSSQALVLHEYSHHFAFSHFPIAYPYWFQEGFAEFNANATFEQDGSVIIGYPANYRGAAVKSGDSLSPKQLFEPNNYGYSYNADLVYGRSWLLTHYLTLNPARRGQLAAYQTAMNNGATSLAAAGKAFGDLGKLNKELDAYAHGRLFSPLRIPASAKPVAVTVIALSPGEAAMLPAHLRMMRGADKYHRIGFATDAEKVAARFPDDSVVASQLAEAELYAERLDRADAAADRALQHDPAMVAALNVKGMAAVRRARLAKATDPAVWTAARGWFLRANRANPDDAVALYQFYASFVAAKTKPTPGAVKGLMRAAAIAPESNEVRGALARQMLADGQPVTARFLLQPIAFAPHAAVDKNIPRQAIALIDAGRPDEARALLSADDENREKRN